MTRRCRVTGDPWKHKRSVWEIYYWDLRTLNNAKPYFFLNEMNKKVLSAIYSAAVWCLFVVLLFFLALLRNHCYSFHRTKCLNRHIGYFREFPKSARIGNSFPVLLGCPFGRYDLGTTLGHFEQSGSWPVATRMPFFSPKFKSAANFSAPA